jgi:hypothetical protein
MLKNTSLFGGKVLSVGPITVIEKGSRNFKRRLLGVISEDNQVIYFEVRKGLNDMPELGKEIVVEYYFAGSCKGDKVYNNIILLTIQNKDV